jgi:hypothetical protein
MLRPLGQYVPNGHTTEVDMPDNRQYLPTGQGVGTLMPVDAQKKPTGHDRGKIEPAGQIDPAGQVVHAAVLVERKKPAPHDDTMGAGVTRFKTPVLRVATNMDPPETSKTIPLESNPMFAH